MQGYQHQYPHTSQMSASEKGEVPAEGQNEEDGVDKSRLGEEKSKGKNSGSAGYVDDANVLVPCSNQKSPDSFLDAMM